VIGGALTAAENVLATIVEPFQGDGVALLQLVYKDPRQPLSIRMNPASLAILKLSVTPLLKDDSDDRLNLRAAGKVPRPWLEIHERNVGRLQSPLRPSVLVANLGSS
jgi:hypothetical protein